MMHHANEAHLLMQADFGVLTHRRHCTAAVSEIWSVSIVACTPCSQPVSFWGECSIS